METPCCPIGTSYVPWCVISDINVRWKNTHTDTHLQPPGDSSLCHLTLLFSVFETFFLCEWSKQSHQYSVFLLSTHPLLPDYQTGLQHRFHNKSSHPFPSPAFLFTHLLFSSLWLPSPLFPITLSSGGLFTVWLFTVLVIISYLSFSFFHRP